MIQQQRRLRCECDVEKSVMNLFLFFVFADLRVQLERTAARVSRRRRVGGRGRRFSGESRCGTRFCAISQNDRSARTSDFANERRRENESYHQLFAAEHDREGTLQYVRHYRNRRVMPSHEGL